MSEYNLQQTTTTTMESTDMKNFEVSSKSADSPSYTGESFWYFSNYSKWNGYYSEIPELKKSIQTKATWVLGQGYNADAKTRIRLEGITGWGEDSFISIMWNMLVTKYVNGDSFAEIVRNDNGTLINLKPLSPDRVKVVVDKKGLIDRYEYLSNDGKTTKYKYKPQEILHFCNDRTADNIHGDSVVEALQWLIDARNEAMRDWRRILHRSTIRVLIVDENNSTKLARIKSQYKTAIKNGELLVLPGKSGEKQFQDLTAPPLEAFLGWIKYLENAFYKAVGVPKTIAGDAEGVPESGGKMAMLTHEPLYKREVRELENDLWNQLSMKITFIEQPSLRNSMNETENKNTGQLSNREGEVTV